MKQRAQKVAGLRLAAIDNPGNGAGQRIGRAFIVFGRVSEEGSHVAERGEADSEDVIVVGREYGLIEQFGIEAVLQADLCGIRRSGKWMSCIAFCPCPIAARYGGTFGNLSVDGFGGVRHQLRLRRVE